MRCGAPSTVIAPQTWIVGGLDLALGEAECASRSNAGEAITSAGDAELVLQEVLAERPVLKANLMSNAVGSAFSILAIASSVKPLAFSVAWLMPGAWPSEPWPTA